MVEESFWYHNGVLWYLTPNGRVSYPLDKGARTFTVDFMNVRNWSEHGYNRIVRKGLASWV